MSLGEVASMLVIACVVTVLASTVVLAFGAKAGAGIVPFFMLLALIVWLMGDGRR